MRLAGLLLIAACSAPARPKPIERLHEPPAPILIVSDGRVSLRASAYVELHAMLSKAARSDDAVAAELEPAKRAYAHASEADLERVGRALAACTDERCTKRAIETEGYAYAYERALPAFVAGEWQARASVSWHAIEVAHASFDPAAEALFLRAAQELEVTWEGAAPVAFATDPPSTEGVPMALPARGRCVARGSAILDCVLVHALIGLPSPLHDKLVRERGPSDGEHAWSELVVRTVASIFRGWNPKHHSVYLRAPE
jgi:hypothetical protein